MTAIQLKSLATGVFWSQLSNNAGISLASSRQLYVYERDTDTQVQVYSDEALTLTVSQPLTTGSDGTPGAVPGYIQSAVSIDFYDIASETRAPAEVIGLGDLQAVGSRAIAMALLL